MRAKYVIIFVTCAATKEAVTIARALLEKRLVACANIIEGVESRFWWKGKIDSAKECLVMLKAKEKNFKRIEYEVKRVHSYEVPEIIALPIAAGSKDYLRWIDEESH
jgi:periplasmic divalent cation tolerance protein